MTFFHLPASQPASVCALRPQGRIRTQVSAHSRASMSLENCCCALWLFIPYSILFHAPFHIIRIYVIPMEPACALWRIAEVIDLVTGFPEPVHHLGIILVLQLLATYIFTINQQRLLILKNKAIISDCHPFLDILQIS